MPGKVKVKIISGRNLPVMDRSSDTTDAYVEIKLGSTTYKTDVCRKSLHPRWDSEWYRFELDDAELQDEPLQIRLMDHDTYSANDAIGKVYLDLNPLLLPPVNQSRYGWNRDGPSTHESPSNSVMSGWIPVYDTMHGIRGEVNIFVKVELFSDFNRFRQSSCGIQFFCSASIPHGYYAQVIQGFVEELVVNDDPEYQWIDKIRTPRASNEARQTLFFKLSRELQRKIGVKALDLGANAVIGYKQCFDLEGESGIVARGIGTAVTLVKIVDITHPVVAESANDECAQSYLKFLGSNASFSLATEQHDPIFSRFIKRYNLHRLSITSLITPTLSRSISSTKESIFMKSSPTLCTTPKHAKSIKTLLEQEDMRSTPGSGISQRLKNFKYSSQNLLSKKMTALKAKLSDSGIEESAEMSPNQALSVVKKKKPFPFKRTVSESHVMAQLLARSVIHAHTSLSCILENQDFNSREDESKAKSSPSQEQDGNNSQQGYLVKSCWSQPTLLSESGKLQSYSNVSTSSTDSSTSDDDDDDDDEDDDDDVLKISDSEFDTVSNIVKNVEILEKRKFSRQFSLPCYPGDAEQMSFETGDVNPFLFPRCVGSDSDLNKDFDETESGKNTSVEKKESEMSIVKCEEKLDSHNDKSENVFNVKTKRRVPELTKQMSFDLDSISQENSNDKTQSEVTEQTLQVPLDNEPETKMIIPPVIIGANIPGRSLVKTAMETILLEKVNIIGNYTPPTSPTSKSYEFNLNSSTTSMSSIISKRNSFANDGNVKGCSRSIAISLADVSQEKETVLGKPFIFMYNITKQQSHPCIFTLSSSNDITKKETVLGVPFQSVNRELLLRKNAQSSFSDSELSKSVDKEKFDQETYFLQIPSRPIIKATSCIQNSSGCFSSSEFGKSLSNTSMESQKTVDKNKETFLHLLKQESPSVTNIDRSYQHSEPNLLSESNSKKDLGSDNQTPKRLSIFKRKFYKSHSNLSDIKSNSSDQLQKKKIGFLHRKSIDHINFKSTKEKSMSILSGIFHRRSKTKDETVIDKSSFKTHGLVGTALGNVVMETVQDILATSQADKKRKISESQKKPTETTSHDTIPSTSTSPNLTLSNNVNKNNNKILEKQASVNTEIDKDAANNINNNKTHASLTPSARNNSSPLLDQHHEQSSQSQGHGHHRGESVGAKISASPAKLNSIPCIHRRSSDSDLSITPKGNSLTGSDRSCGMSGGHPMRSSGIMRTTLAQDNFDMLEYPFLTMQRYPSGFILQLGGAVCARSVKLLERISNLEEPESRDTWWSEIRMEIRSHARALNCNAVLGYTETTTICEDVCVLSASGTAAVIAFHYTGEMADNLGGLPIIPKPQMTNKEMMTTSLDRSEFEKDKILPKEANKEHGTFTAKTLPESPDHDTSQQTSTVSSCEMCHLPYNLNNVPVRAITTKCVVCRNGRVPEVLIATIEMPEGVLSVGRGCFIQSIICRPLKDSRGESNAKEISDGLPFLEYELHRVLVNKLKIKGMNSIFGLKIRISIGEKMLIGIATGTASFIAALPVLALPKLVSVRQTDQKKLSDLQKHLQDIVTKNREIYQLKDIDEIIANGKVLSDNDDSDDEQSALELSLGNKDCCVLEVDDPEDEEVLHLLMEGRPPDGFHVVNTEFVPGLEELEIVKNLQMFTQIYRAKLQPPYNLDHHLHRLLQTLYFKLRRMVPCALCDLQFRVDLPESDEIQLCVLGMALGLGDPQKNKPKRKNTFSKKNDDDLIFNLEEDQGSESSSSQNYLNTHQPKFRPKSPSRSRNYNLRQRHMPYRERHGVDITPLSYVPGGNIERYLGNLNFFFIRETTSIREEGGLSGFIHSFVTEVLAIVRAHVTALGGNAMVGYFMTECILNHSLHKNQGQCLINVGGDVVQVSYNEDA